jgi:hypothetical protein
MKAGMEKYFLTLGQVHRYSGKGLLRLIIFLPAICDSCASKEFDFVRKSLPAGGGRFAPGGTCVKLAQMKPPAATNWVYYTISRVERVDALNRAGFGRCVLPTVTGLHQKKRQRLWVYSRIKRINGQQALHTTTTPTPLKEDWYIGNSGHLQGRLKKTTDRLHRVLFELARSGRRHYSTRSQRITVTHYHPAGRLKNHVSCSKLALIIYIGSGVHWWHNTDPILFFPGGLLLGCIDVRSVKVISGGGWAVLSTDLLLVDGTCIPTVTVNEWTL